ncbi:uncharacterized protein CC84DRAFT_1180102 [Paraphaeosphaeria sporulosa]|uniref:Uncharacterized protein n=1 Tax=Paraphaeosphaeria sporulosa TaxID=1460663 RepID=A0A177C0K3_9PLEO|nr:uncharacterized protein CC84DRAFT_1180102 [Paraphaeosphaeria sporulosa]OAG01015.1 hypothetical protein CC84DRAFT_1180102 [Paraphaeosphaeria sporulosa]
MPTAGMIRTGSFSKGLYCGYCVVLFQRTSVMSLKGGGAYKFEHVVLGGACQDIGTVSGFRKNLHKSIGISISKTVQFLADNPYCGDSLQIALVELECDGQNARRRRRSHLYEEYVAWHSSEFNQYDPIPYEPNSEDGEIDEEMVVADLVNLPLQAVGPRIFATEVSDVVTGPATITPPAENLDSEKDRKDPSAENPGSVCWDELFASTEDPSMQLKNCDHRFHKVCLET